TRPPRPPPCRKRRARSPRPSRSWSRSATCSGAWRSICGWRGRGGTAAVTDRSFTDTAPCERRGRTPFAEVPAACLPAPARPTLRPAPSTPTLGPWRPTMATRRHPPAALVAFLALAALAACAAQGVRPQADDIAGVVTGPNGPEAGVWVIAETEDLPTRF